MAGVTMNKDLEDITKIIIALPINIKDLLIKMAAAQDMGRGNIRQIITEEMEALDMVTIRMMISLCGFGSNLTSQLLPSTKFYDGYKPHKTL